MPTIGLRDLHYAKITSDKKEGVVYGTPKRMAKAISANIAPTVNSASLYADDGLSETAEALGEINVTINTDDLPKQVQADLLGHKIDDNGILVKSADDKAPYVAIGFRAEKSNGKFRYVWMLKGKFRPSEQNHQTKEGTPAFQTPTINGTFMKRDFDNNWQALADEDDADLGESVVGNWFNKVYGSTEAGV